MKLNKEDKWILVSCLQKSIRKGFVDLAIKYADLLYDLEKSYLFYRLSIIAVEDIGLANINLIHEYISSEIKKANIEERGGKDYILDVVQKFAESGKDRSACDLISISFFEKNKIFDKTNYKSIFVDESIDLTSRLLAGWQSLGNKKFEHNFVDNNLGNIDYFIQLNSFIVDNEKLLDVMRYCHNFQREPHFISLGLLYSVLEKEKSKNLKLGKYNIGDFVEKQYDKKIVNDKWLIDGVDWHTKDGKYAIYEFIKEKTPLTQYLKTMIIDNETIASIIGLLLFRLIGQQVNKRMVYEHAVHIMKSSEKLSFDSIVNFEGADYNKSINLLKNDLDILYSKINSQFNQTNPNHFPF